MRSQGSHRIVSGLTAAVFTVAQFVLPPSASASLGSSTASAGSAPPPAVSAVQSFQPDLFTGRATTSIPIAVPPGRKGVQPSLALGYSSSGRNGWLGIGWSSDLGAIERSTKTGPPRYDASDTFTLTFQGVSSELVQIPDGTYRAKDEGLFLRIVSNGVGGWEVTDKSGTRYRFGQTTASQIAEAGQVFRWALDQVVDPNGNAIAFLYSKDQGQLYPATIRYTAHQAGGLAPTNQVEFVLEDRPDIETSYRSGFPITTAKRLKAIEAKATRDGILSLARRYDINYTVSPRTGRSLLSGVTQIGTDGVTSLPPMSFSYTQDAPTYLHCHNCVPSISSGSKSWQLQLHAGNLFPRDDANDQRLWPGGGWEPGVKQWGEEICRRRGFRKRCQTVARGAAIPALTWGGPRLELSGSDGGVSWSTDASGNLSVSGPQDTHLLATAWLYTSTAKTVTVSLSTNGRADVFYVSPGGTSWSAAANNQVPLSPGWTVVAVTAYNELGSLSLSMSANLGTQVGAMNHAQFSPMGISGDFDGDGLTDLAHLEPAANHWHVVLNSRNGFGQEQTWLNATLPAQTATLVGDVDADGKADLVLWNTSTGLWQVAKSTGSSFSAPATWHSGFGAGETPLMGDFNGDQLLDVGTFSNGTWRIALSAGANFNDPTTWLSNFGAGAQPLTGDFNGDGLTDLAVASNGTISVALSTGTQFVVQPTVWATGFGAGQSLTSADLNGDGLTDLVYYDKTTGATVVAPSTGSGFGPAQTLMSDHPFELRGPDDTFQVGDFSGKGLSGFGVFNPVSGVTEIAHAMGDQPDLLAAVANGLGGSTTLRYQASTQCDNVCPIEGVPKLPFVLPLVRSVTVSDGLDHSVTTNYRYEKGRYDPAAREFRGFATVAVTDAAGTTTTTTFSQDVHTKGRPFTVEVRDVNGRLFTKTANTWSCTEPFAGVHFTKLDQTDSFVYDGDDSFRQTRSRLTYDQYGNVTRTDEDGDVSITGDERAGVTSFSYDTSAWILSKPTLTQTLSAAGAVVSQRRFAYDAVGNLTEEEEWLKGSPDQWLATTLTYDATGNLLTVTDALGRTTTNTYDATGTYLVQIANALGHTRQLAYDPRLGQVTGSTDQNGVVTTTEYDALGRVAKVIGPTDTAALPTISYDYDLTTVPIKTTTRTRLQSGQPAMVTVYAFADGLGRTIQTRAPAEDSTKQVVTGTVEFDARGQVIKQWVPYLDVFSESYRPIALVTGYSSLATISYTYDAVGRSIETTDPDGSKTLVDYNDAETTTTLANGTQTQKLTDAYGRLIRIEEVLSETAGHVTTYAYDTLGNLLQVTDANGNVTRMTYDTLGRKIAMDDPDMGHWTYAYDVVDNLTSQTDARNITTTFTYDALNRVTQKSYAIPQGSDIRPQTSVTYTYDNPAKPFSKGKLTEITDGSGSSSFEYDALGRLIKESKTLSAEGGSASGGDGTTYTIQRAYDLPGRLTSLTYPDGDVATYTYNAQGGIETIRLQTSDNGFQDIVTDVSYNAAGQLTKLVYGNGTTSDYTYDPQTLRLSHLLTSSLTHSTLQDFSYAFDAIGNVTAITDQAHTGTQTFQYDKLNRLTEARGAYGTLAYAYDPIGNMTSKEGTAMTYGLADGSKPHAVTSAISSQQSALSLTYDANGNLLEKQSQVSSLLSQVLSYDAENRLVEVQSPQEETVTLTFHPGWNFFSLPVVPDDLRITAIFPTFGTDFDQLAWFDANPATPDDQRFKHFVNLAKFNDFDRLEYGQGYQLYCKNPNGVTVTLKGKLPTQRLSRTLLPGWHLLPALSIQQSAISQVFGSVDSEQILRYDTTNSSLTTPTSITPGEAYFVKVRTSSTWTPPLPRDVTTRFVYDGDGGRVKQITASGTTRFLGESYEVAPDGARTKYVFAGSQRVAAITTAPGQQVAKAPSWWRRALSSLLAWLDLPSAEAAVGPGIQFYHGDHLGSSNVVTDGAGALVELDEHMPYGALHRREGIADVPQKFTGQRSDVSTGLYFYHARYYDPSLGRFISADPLVQDPSDPQSLNRYAYVRNNPVNFVDPSGHFWQFIVAAIAAVFVVAAVVSVVASNISLIASATGHERTAQRAARVAVTAGQVAFWMGTAFSIATGGEGWPAAAVGSAVLAYAYFAQGVARDTDPEGANQPLGTSVAKNFTNEALQQTPVLSEIYGGWMAISGVNPFTNESLSPLQRGLLGGALIFAALYGIRVATARSFANAIAAEEGTETVQRAMSHAELKATESSGLLRGGREGTHYVSDAISTDALRARQRLSLDYTPEVRVTLEVPKGKFSSPSKVLPKYDMYGGGSERTATGQVPATVLRVDDMK